MIRKIVPSISMWDPFLNWLVLITAANPREAESEGGGPYAVEAGE
jgi:hypothetical protein